MVGTIAFVNGAVVPVDPGSPPAEAVVVGNGRIVAVGPERALRAQIAAADVIDLAGRALLPGFQDAHVHPSMAGLIMLRCDLHGLSGREEYLGAVAAYAAAHPDTEWIVGAGWSMDAFPGGRADRRDLDAVVADRPVFLVNRDGHGAWLNSRALEIAGIDHSTPDPFDGRIERDASGDPLGTLQEGAMALVQRVLPATSAAERDEGILAAQRYLLSLGITAWQDAWVTAADHEAYLRLAASGRLVARVVGALWWERDRGVEQIGELKARRRAGPLERYRASTVKIMLDGVCENHTAAMLEPYVARVPETSGLDFVDPELLPGIVTSLASVGFQVHFHAIGDRAARHALDAVAAARRALGYDGNRHHIAHLQVVDPADVPRFGPLNVTANAQPRWAHLDTTQTELTMPFLGDRRSRAQYPFGSLVEAGARLAIGSDWSVSTPDPFEVLHVAVHRTDPTGNGATLLGGEQRLDLATALTAYTMGSAYVNHLDRTTGSITAGKDADLVVADRAVGAPGVPLAGTRVDLAMIAGEVVHQRG